MVSMSKSKSPKFALTGNVLVFCPISWPLHIFRICKQRNSLPSFSRIPIRITEILAMLSTGAVIWISLRPLIRLVFCVTCGILITKADVFPAVAARGAGQVVLNIALPCLLFSKIVPAFTADNVNALGPLVLVAILYEIMGGLLAWTIKQLFWVPHRFRYGILVAGAFGNVGDIPTSVIMTVTGAAPFLGVNDQNLSVAYIAAFILVFMVTLFPFGGHNLIAWDYTGPDIEREEVQEAMRRKRRTMVMPFHRIRRLSATKKKDCEQDIQEQISTDMVEKKALEEVTVQAVHRKHVAFADDATTVAITEGPSSPVCSPPSTDIDIFSRVNSIEPTATTTWMESVASKTALQTEDSGTVLPTHPTPDPSQPAPFRKSRLRRLIIHRQTIKNFLHNLFTPASIAIFASFPIALVPKLKALFVDVPGTYMPSAPDGQPPLAFVMDATTFVGAASVPLGLICLGSSLARLPIPKKGEWQKLPLGAIGFLAVGKMILMPVLGVLMCEGLTKVGVMSRDDKVLRFVCIFFSSLPTATTQVFLTQVYSGTGSAEHISAFLIPQYFIMFVSMTAITAYSLQLLF